MHFSKFALLPPSLTPTDLCSWLPKAMPGKNTGKPYEALTEVVFARLLAQDKSCADVARDTKMRGKTGTTHQIDVSFSFVIGGTKYLTLVQCKDWASAVKQEQVMAFHDVLNDIPGQPRGIMVSRSGFQEGARTIASHHGICLYELREPKDEDWAGLIRTINMTAKIQMPVFRSTRLNPDEDWIREQLTAHGIKELTFNAEIIPGVTKAVFESGEECNLETMLNGHLPQGPCDWTSITHEFPSPLYVDVDCPPLTRLRMRSVTSDVRISEIVQLWTFKVDHLVAYCFRDVFGGTSKFLDKDGKPLGGDSTNSDEP